MDDTITRAPLHACPPPPRGKKGSPLALLSPPVKGTWGMALKLLVAIMVPSLVVTSLAGSSASMAFGIAVGIGMAAAPISGAAGAAISVSIGAALATLSSLAGSSPWPIAALTLAAALCSALANRRSAGLMSLAPILVVLFGPGPIDLPWWTAALWVLGGGITGYFIARILKFQAVATPVSRAVAWEHGLAVGISSAIAMAWALSQDIPHGYWVAVTILMALRPLPDQRRSTLRGRLAGTLLGAVLALVVVMFASTTVALAVAAGCLFFLIWYSMGGAYLMQTLALTPMMLIFASLGDKDRGIELTLERASFTIIGFVLSCFIAWALYVRDRKRPTSLEQKG